MVDKKNRSAKSKLQANANVQVVPNATLPSAPNDLDAQSILPSIEVCPEPAPDPPTRMPRGAVYVGGVHRGCNAYGDELITWYSLSRTQPPTYWVLWEQAIDNSDYGRHTMTAPIAWCRKKGVDAASAASAMLEHAWASTDICDTSVDEDTTVDSKGLLSFEELEATLRRALDAKSVEESRRYPNAISRPPM